MQKPFNPLEPLNFGNDICFLTGEKLQDPEKEVIHVFPKWLLDRYELHGKTLTMLGGNRMKYDDMLLPASPQVRAAIEELDRVTQKAFEEGFETVRKLPELTIFQWMGRVLYGVLYQDFTYAIFRRLSKGMEFKMSELVKLKVKNFHLMLQSLIRPVVFDGFKPWSMKCYQVNISKDILNYEDESHNLCFLLGMNGFAIAASLQDNGEVGDYLKDITQKIGDETVLHPIQMEEYYGRLNYATYLLRPRKDYIISEGSNGEIIFKLSELSEQEYPRFGQFEEKIYAQVMANLWVPWGIPLEKIWVFPNSPMSFLINETTNEFIRPEQVKHPY